MYNASKNSNWDHLLQVSRTQTLDIIVMIIPYFDGATTDSNWTLKRWSF